MQLQLKSQSVSNLVSQLEEARASGTLGDVLNQAENNELNDRVVAFYRKLDGQPVLKSRFRPRHVQSIIREAMWPLRKPQIMYSAVLRKHQAVKRDTGNLQWIITHLESGSIVLRADQVRSASYWGIGFDLSSDEDNQVLEEYLLRSSVNLLLSMLRDLELVESNFLRTHYETDHILPSRRSVDFEQLLIDVLNERDPTASHASLSEDLLEKTDLRVHVQGVRRKLGARVQVTMMVDPLLYLNKLASIHRLEEIVVLSPASLARFATDTGKELAQSINRGSGTALLKEQATEIRATLFAATSKLVERMC